jgi:MoaA/NifB/PqqE/SkfB family radical SAM enzyme
MVEFSGVVALWTRMGEVGRRAGLTDEAIGLALERLMTHAQKLASATDASTAQVQQRLLEGVARNLEEDPMLVAWALRLASTLGNTQWERFFENFVVKLVAERPELNRRLHAELGYLPPVSLVVNPTMACNLRCRGCYAFEFSREESMSPELFRRVVTQARDLGIRVLVITGGEPFIYKPLVDMALEFSDMTFLTYTNGTLLDEAMADRVALAGNIFPALSVEGYQPETDARRGAGVHAGVVAAMKRLRDRGVLFGISVTPTSLNVDTVTQDAFLDHYLGHGISFAWMFTYIPVGKDPELSLMVSPEQRDQLRQATVRWHKTRPVFIGDFWNDGPQCGGCLSASRYAFVQPDGRVQPCTFVHFYTHNIKEHSLREIFDSPFFEAIRGAQPYHRNLLRPCKIIDHPHVLRQLVEDCGARPSYDGADTLVRDPVFTRALDEYAQRYGKIADAAWQGPDYQDGHAVRVPFSGIVDLYTRFPDRMDNAEARTLERAHEAGQRAAADARAAPPVGRA